MTFHWTSELTHAFQTEGFVHLRGLFTAQEAANYRKEAHDLLQRLGQRASDNPTWSSVNTGKTVIQHCHDVQTHSSAFTRLLLDPRLTQAMAGCIGPNVQLHHTKMFIKPPEKGSPFPMHQDYPYFPHARHTMTAAIIHFDDAPIAKGCLRVVPRSHKLGPLMPHNLKDFSLSPTEYPIESAHAVEATAGDVLIFNYLVIHGSGINVSNEARTTLLVQFRDPADEPLLHTHESRSQGLMLAGIDPNAGRTPVLADDPAYVFPHTVPERLIPEGRRRAAAAAAH
jgi:phytanoyl-CoA hydroxylase